jgi:hypothetical protein
VTERADLFSGSSLLLGFLSGCRFKAGFLMGFQMVYSLSSPGDEPSRVPMSLIVGSSTVADMWEGGQLLFYRAAELPFWTMCHPSNKL